MKKYIILLLGLVAGCKSANEVNLGDCKVIHTTNVDPTLNFVTKSNDYQIPTDQEIGYEIYEISSNQLVAQGDNIFTAGDFLLSRGSYKLSLDTDEAVKHGFDTPMYSGEATFEAISSQSTIVNTVAKLNCVVVDVNYSEQMKQLFSEIKTTVSSGSAADLLFDKFNEKLGYFLAPISTLSYTIEVVANNGWKYTASGDVESLKKGDLLQLNFDIKPNGENITEPLVIDLVLDRVVNEEVKTITIGANYDTKEGPVIEGRRLNLDKEIGVKFGNFTKVLVDIGTVAGLKDVVLMLNDVNLTNGFGVQNISLMSEANLSALGLKFDEGGLPGSTESLVDLTNLTPILPGDLTGVVMSNISLGVLDNNGQYSVRELKFKVYGVPLTTLGVENNTNIDWFGEHGAINRVNVKLNGIYNVDIAPEGLTFQYREKTTQIWKFVDAVVGANKQLSVILPMYADGKTYEYQLLSNTDNGDIKEFSIPAYPSVADMGFENWSQGNNMNMENSSINSARPWGSSNNDYGTNVTISGDGFKGNCIRLESMKIGAFGITKFASGALYTGTMKVNMSSPWESSKFGLAFTGRPKGLRVRYKYAPNNINETGDLSSYIGFADQKPVNGQPDQFEVSIKLEKWGGGSHPVRWRDGFLGTPVSNPLYDGYADAAHGNASRRDMYVGCGSFSSNVKKDSWTEVDIMIDYDKDPNDSTKYIETMPDHIIISAASSKFGGYMTGALGSVLWIDELEFIW